jgi:PucR C-terminal helix-turn-helix domain
VSFLRWSFIWWVVAWGQSVWSAAAASVGRGAVEGGGEFGVLALGGVGGHDRLGAVEGAGPLVQLHRHAGLQQPQPIGDGLVAERVQRRGGDVGRVCCRSSSRAWLRSWNRTGGPRRSRAHSATAAAGRVVGGSVRSSGGTSGRNASGWGSTATVLSSRVHARPSWRSPPPGSSATRRAFHPDGAPVGAALLYPGDGGLVQWLSHLDAQAEGALRVVVFDDTLLRRRWTWRRWRGPRRAWRRAWPGSGRTPPAAPSACPPTAATRRPAKAAPLGEVGVILAATVDPARFPKASAPASAPPTAPTGPGSRPGSPWASPPPAGRSSTPTTWARWRCWPTCPDAVGANPDVAAIAGVAADPEDLATLEAYGAAGSLRRAAGRLHRHHSSVARRLDQLGAALGIDLAQPTGLLRAHLALTTWRLLNH